MKDFTFYAPTEIVFGRQSEKQIGKLVRKHGGTKVLLHYGGQSAKRSGLLDNVRQMFKNGGIEFIELSDVQPNPILPKVYEGITLCQKEKIDFILAVGGGSVIDSAKAIAYGINYDGDVWDFFNGKAKATSTIPVGVVLTIPAAGSEMSNGCVITNPDGNLKRAYDDDLSRPRFAVMNPERTYTLPAYQTACGVTDIMMHTMERYFSQDDDMELTDNIAEALLRTVIESASVVLQTPDNYRHRAQIMWAGSLSHNGLTGCGTIGDYATHMLEHELSALFNVAHGAGLSAIWGSWARYVYRDNINRFVRFAVNVMGIANDFTNPESTALRGIEAMELFYRSIAMPISIHELIGREITIGEIQTMVDKCSHNGNITIGNFKKLNQADMEAIYMAAKNRN